MDAQILNLRNQIAELERRTAPIIAGLEREKNELEVRIAALEEQLASNASDDLKQQITTLREELATLKQQLVAQKKMTEDQKKLITDAVGDDALNPKFDLKVFINKLKGDLAKVTGDLAKCQIDKDLLVNKIDRLLGLLRINDDLKSNISRWLNGEFDELDNNFFENNIQEQVKSILGYTDLLIDYVLLPIEQSNLSGAIREDVLSIFNFTSRDSNLEFKELQKLLEDVFRHRNLFNSTTNRDIIEVVRGSYPYLQGLIDQNKTPSDQEYKSYFEKTDDVFYMTSFTNRSFKRFKKLPISGIPIRILAIRFFQLYREKIQNVPFTDHAIYDEGTIGPESVPVPVPESVPVPVPVPEPEPEPVPKGKKSKYDILGTHLKTFPFILNRITSSSKSSKENIDKNITAFGQLGVNNKDAPIKQFIDEYLSSADFLKGTNIKDLNKLGRGVSNQIEEDNILEDGDNSEYAKIFQEYFNKIYTNMATLKSLRDAKFIKFIYDFFTSYIKTYGVEKNLNIETDVPHYYNKFIKYFIGDIASKILKDKFKTDENIIEDLIKYANIDYKENKTRLIYFNIPTGRKQAGGAIEDIESDDPLEVYNHDFINLDDVF